MSEFEYWQMKSSKRRVDARLTALEYELTELLAEMEIVSEQSVRLEAKLAKQQNEVENQPWMNRAERIYN